MEVIKMGTNKPELQYQPSEGRTGRPRKAVVDGKQQCSTCREWKPLDDFYPAKHTYNGRETRCNLCSKVKTRNYYSNDIVAYLRVSWVSHKSASGYRGRSKRRVDLAVESEVTHDYLVYLWHKQKGVCALTGLPMTHRRGAGHHVCTNVSIDRIDSRKGYTKDNVRLVCKAANIMKYIHTDQEMVKWARAIVNGPVAQRLSGDATSEPAEGEPCITGRRLKEKDNG